MFNAHDGDLEWRLPPVLDAGFDVVVDTGDPSLPASGAARPLPGESWCVPGRTVLVLERPLSGEAPTRASGVG